MHHRLWDLRLPPYAIREMRIQLAAQEWFLASIVTIRPLRCVSVRCCVALRHDIRGGGGSGLAGSVLVLCVFGWIELRSWVYYYDTDVLWTLCGQGVLLRAHTRPKNDKGKRMRLFACGLWG